MVGSKSIMNQLTVSFLIQHETLLSRNSAEILSITVMKQWKKRLAVKEVHQIALRPHISLVPERCAYRFKVCFWVEQPFLTKSEDSKRAAAVIKCKTETVHKLLSSGQWSNFYNNTAWSYQDYPFRTRSTKCTEREIVRLHNYSEQAVIALMTTWARLPSPSRV